MNKIKICFVFVLVLMSIFSVAGYEESRLIRFEMNVSTVAGVLNNDTNLTTPGRCEIRFIPITEKTAVYLEGESSGGVNVNIGDFKKKQLLITTQIEVSSMMENFSKSIDSLVASNKICSEFVNDSKSYYEKYTGCNAEYLSLKTQYEDIKPDAEDYPQCKSSLDSCSNTRDEYSNKYSTCETNKKKAENDRYTWAVIAAIAGAVAYHFFTKKKEPQAQETRDFGSGGFY